jgi:hypothetical protein
MHQAKVFALESLYLEAVVQFAKKERARLDCGDGL